MAGVGGATGGSSAGAIEAGRAFVSLSAKDDMAPGLRAAQRKIAEFGDEATKELSKKFSAADIGKSLIGGLTGGGIATFASMFGSKLREELSGALTDAINLDTLEKVTERIEKRFKAIADNMTATRTQFEMMFSAAEDPATKLAIRQRDYNQDIENVTRLQKQRNLAEAELKVLNVKDSATRAGVAIFGDLSVAEQEAAKRKQIEEIDAELKKTRDRMTNIGSEIGTLRTAAAEWRNKQRADELKDAAVGFFGDVKDLVKNITNEAQPLAEQFAAGVADIRDYRALLTVASLKAATRGLSAADTQLAELVQRGLSNDQIMRLRTIGQDLQTGNDNGFFSRGSFASGSLAQSVGIADQWKSMEKQQELTVKKLDEIRRAMDMLRMK